MITLILAFITIVLSALFDTIIYRQKEKRVFDRGKAEYIYPYGIIKWLFKPYYTIGIPFIEIGRFRFQCEFITVQNEEPYYVRYRVLQKAWEILLIGLSLLYIACMTPQTGHYSHITALQSGVYLLEVLTLYYFMTAEFLFYMFYLIAGIKVNFKEIFFYPYWLKRIWFSGNWIFDFAGYNFNTMLASVVIGLFLSIIICITGEIIL